MPSPFLPSWPLSLSLLDNVEKLTAEVALSFLSPPPNAQMPNQPRALTEERKSKN